MPPLPEMVSAVSLAVEAAGFFLVVLDLYAPSQAQRLERAIARTSDFLDAWKRRGVRPADEPLKGTLSFTSLLTGTWLILLPIRAALLALVWLALWPLRLTLVGLDRLARGHALAGLGLVLAFAGLCLELYELVAF